MGFADKYLQKNTLIDNNKLRAPNSSGPLKYIVVIPAYSEQGIFSTLNSICNCVTINDIVEVLILINYPENCSKELKEQNISIYNELVKWSEAVTGNIVFTPLLLQDIPDRLSGAGYARKVLMDLACQKFNQVNNPDGFILSLDADTMVPPDYFISIINTVQDKRKTDCLIFNFQHPTSGEFSPQVYNAIARYELHLRYYKHFLCKINYPYYHYTIGSCFGIKANTYAKVGGMSKRKAGEDFYFLQKVFPNASVEFLNKVVLTPSPRPSWRVPFGTGPAIRKMLGGNSSEYITYHPKSFHSIEKLLQLAPGFYSMNETDCEKSLSILPNSFKEYLYSVDILKHIEEVKNNSASEQAFIKRFYNWFDAFNLLKFLNYAKEHHNGAMEVVEATNTLLGTNQKNVFKLLEMARRLDLEK